MSKLLPTSGFKWIDPKEFDLNKYTINSSKGCVLEVYLEYPKELQELQNDYHFALDRIVEARIKTTHTRIQSMAKTIC